MADVELSALMPEDAVAARAFVASQLRGTRYESRVLEQLDAALAFDDPEYMALLARDGAATVLRGLVLFGTVAGARGVVKVHVLLGQDVRGGEALADAVQTVSRDAGERMLVAEMADDAPFCVAVQALTACGFAEEGRVPDFVRDGVAMRLLVWRSNA